MRHLITMAVLAFGMSTITVQDSWAGKKGGSEEAADKDEFDIVMEPTGSPKLDTVFKKSEGPLETVAKVRDDVRGVNTNLVKSMGLKDGTPFADALADLQNKAENKINVAFDDNALPKFSVEDGVPDNVKSSVDSLNKSFGRLQGANDKLGTAAEQMLDAATEAADLISTPKELGLKATQIPKALSKGNKNIKTLKQGASVTKDLLGEVNTLFSDVKSTFAN